MSGHCPPEYQAEFIQDAARYVTTTLVEKYGKCETTIREWKLNLYREGKLLWWPGIRLCIDLPIADCLQIEAESAIVAGDLEIPYQDSQLLGYMVEIAKRFGAKSLIVAGDFVALDELSSWPVEEERFRTLADSLQDGREVLEDLLEHFEAIYLIKGNHEQRGSRRAEIGFYSMVNNSWDLPQVAISFYKWCVLISAGKEYRIEHPKNYSRLPGSVVRDRAEIEGTNVMAGHTHHFSWSFTKDGNYSAVDIGHCTRPETRYYKTANDTVRYPKWTAGFWLVHKGYLYPFPKMATDWEWWLAQQKRG